MRIWLAETFDRWTQKDHFNLQYTTFKSAEETSILLSPHSEVYDLKIKYAAFPKNFEQNFIVHRWTENINVPQSLKKLTRNWTRCQNVRPKKFDETSWSHPSFRSRPKLSYDQTHSNAHPCVPRPNFQGLDSGSNAKFSAPWSGFCLIRGHFGLRGLIIVFIFGPWSGLCLIRGHLGLKILIITFIVWTMFWVRSEKSDHRTFRTRLSLIIRGFERT